MFTKPRLSLAVILEVCLLLSVIVRSSAATATADAQIGDAKLAIAADQKAGTYTIQSKENLRISITAGMAAQVNHRWLRVSDYARHEIQESSFTDDLGTGSQLTITYTGLSGQPDLVCSL